jgi:hypothetical protein
MMTTVVNLAIEGPLSKGMNSMEILGASWVFYGYRGTLAALQQMVKPGGLILVGEPFWKGEPDPAYLATADFQPDTFGRHVDNVTAGEGLGLSLLHTIVSSEDDWDRYDCFLHDNFPL